MKNKIIISTSLIDEDEVTVTHEKPFLNLKSITMKKVLLAIGFIILAALAISCNNGSNGEECLCDDYNAVIGEPTGGSVCTECGGIRYSYVPAEAKAYAYAGKMNGHENHK